MIRDYDPARDRDGVRDCFAELQDVERGLEPVLPEGRAVADAYVERYTREILDRVPGARPLSAGDQDPTLRSDRRKQRSLRRERDFGSASLSSRSRRAARW